jgi:O-antigen/teichoic acid export membrane protein
VKPIPLEICNDSSQEHITRKNIYLNGYYYFITGIAGLLISSSDGLVISHFLNASMIPYFALPYKLIWVFIAILGQGLTLFIAKILILHQKNNHISLQSLISKLVFFSLLLCCLGAVGSIFFSIEVVKAWSNGHVVIDNLTVIFLALYLLSAGVSEVPYYILLSLNKVKQFYLLALLEGVSNLILSIYFIRILGVAGVVCATALSHIVFTSVYYNYILYRDYKNIYTSRIVNHLVKTIFIVLVIMMIATTLVLYFKITVVFKVILLVLLTCIGVAYAKSQRYL